MQVRIAHPGPVTGPHTAAAGTGPAQQKVLHPLARRRVPAAQAVGRPLQPSLKGDARQGMPASEVLRRHIHQQAAVDVFPVSCVFAHAVGHRALPFRSRCHYLSPGAHTEGKHAPSAGQVAG